jgi:membrane associated rhomboid family serine protease
MLSKSIRFLSSARSPQILSNPGLGRGRGYHPTTSRLQDTFANRQRFLWGLVGVNATVFGLWQYSESTRNFPLNKFLMRHFTLSEFGVRVHHRFHTMLTAAFSHRDLSHFAFNMIALYTFGVNTIHYLGLQRFALLYLGGALFSSFFQLIWPSMIPKSWPAKYNYNRNSVILGASGAVNAVVAWNILTFPRNMLYIYAVIPVPAALAGLAFLGMDAYGLYSGTSATGNAAHISGAVIGVLAFVLSRGKFRNF